MGDDGIVFPDQTTSTSKPEEQPVRYISHIRHIQIQIQIQMQIQIQIQIQIDFRCLTIPMQYKKGVLQYMSMPDK